MKHKIGKMISCVLALSMMMSVLPTTAFADETAVVVEQEQEEVQEVEQQEEQEDVQEVEQQEEEQEEVAQEEQEEVQKVFALTATDDSWYCCEECSESNPHMIYTTADLDNIRTHMDESGYITGYFQLANDIVFTDADFAEGGDFYNDGKGFTPIGNREGISGGNWFTGNFDGNGKTIENVVINPDNQYLLNRSLFGLVKDASIYDLNIEDITVYGDHGLDKHSAAASIASVIWNSSFENIDVSNAFVDGSVYSGALFGRFYLSSTVNNITANNIEMSAHSHNNSGQGYYSAGIVGGIQASTSTSEIISISNVDVTNFKYTYGNKILFAAINTPDTTDITAEFSNFSVELIAFDETPLADMQLYATTDNISIENCVAYYETNDAITIFFADNQQATFVTNDGALPSDLDTSELTLPTPTNGDFIFVGWFDNADFTGDATTIAVEGKTYYAKWLANQTPIVFTNEKYVTAGETLDITATSGDEVSGEVVYILDANGTGATLEGTTLTAGDTTGMVTITATKAGNVNYFSTTSSMTIFILASVENTITEATVTGGGSISNDEVAGESFGIVVADSISAEDKEKFTVEEDYTEGETFYLYAMVKDTVVADATFDGTVTVTISYPVESGRTYQVLHAKQDGEIETLSATANVAEQTLSFAVSELSPFMVVSKISSSSSKSYYIKATATAGGTVAPEDTDVSLDSMYKVSKMSDVTFEFGADYGYEVADVIVNGKSVGACDEYTFEDIIITMQTLEVVFEKSSSSSSSSSSSDDDEEAAEEETEAIELPFVDIDEEDDNFDGIAYVYENGIMAGISSDVFGGELSITRAMIAAILYRINGSEAIEGDMPFGDVSADQYYYDAVVWGKAEGVMAGVSTTEFAPNTAITNEQFVAFLYRYANILGMDMTVDYDTDLSDYTISAYAITAIAWALENDIIEKDDLEPMATAMRGDVATALMNFIEMM